ncbi:rhomboid family intramembrane serine protease [Noviluteimonas gilva]|uniref:Rhomboid family intramembrane serine protease n=1 Tax=Noviluteimonas gilva TaxID=2682097 RepID=A0A7C9M251_9GAMM|nr:rhomboid family intramembrane serine protease [Lysobacter gilvus]MUV13142.1 rhomboid family intramembrane serine protease [Lysobacter gilvus]
MHLPTDAYPDDPKAQRLHDKRRVQRAVLWTVAAAFVLCVIYACQGFLPVDALTVTPGTAAGWLGVLTAPLLHGSPDHLLSNVAALLLLGTLAGSVYPRATVRTVPIAWIGSGVMAWFLGDAGSHHLGASGVLQGLAYLVATLGLLRRDRASIAAAMIAFVFSGGMLVTVLPYDPTISWQSHLGGALGGIASAIAFRHADPPAPRQRYSWEDEPEEVDSPSSM